MKSFSFFPFKCTCCGCCAGTRPRGRRVGLAPERVWSPPCGFSTLTTSAPWSPSIAVHSGPRPSMSDRECGRRAAVPAWLPPASGPNGCRNRRFRRACTPRCVERAWYALAWICSAPIRRQEGSIRSNWCSLAPKSSPAERSPRRSGLCGWWRARSGSSRCSGMTTGPGRVPLGVVEDGRSDHLDRGARAARVLFRRPAPAFRRAARSARHAVPTSGLGRACRDPLRRDAQLWRRRRRDRATHRFARGGRRQRPQPDFDHRPMPPRNRCRRKPDRFCRRSRGQADPAGPSRDTGRGACSDAADPSNASQPALAT